MLVIGKYTLESLTYGMYNHPYILFREYIQNSADAIDEAINNGLISKEDSFINIVLNQKENIIIIEDNGIGIKSSEAYKTLTDIGNSKKQFDISKGFRGIGRLIGLSFCDYFSFETSYKGENIKSRISFDSQKLNELLIPSKYEDIGIEQVIEEITKVEFSEEISDLHYFSVKMEKIHDKLNLFEADKVKKFLCQVAPLPFNNKRFSFAEKINLKQKEFGLLDNTYNVFFKRNFNAKYTKLYKPYKKRFSVNKSKRSVVDTVKDIEIKVLRNNSDNKPLALVWYGKCNLLGSIVDKEIKGLRLRKSNILVGNDTTLRELFKEERFNGWIQGEVIICHPNIIPNARRDDFEKNETYLELREKLRCLTDELSLYIREKSKKRNMNNNNKEHNSKKSNNGHLLNKIDELIECSSSNIKLREIKKILDQELPKQKTEKIMDSLNKIIIGELK